MIDLRVALRSTEGSIIPEWGSTLLEVEFERGLMWLGKCQSQNFAAQIAATYITALQYNILTLAKRFSSYETIGGVFKDAHRKIFDVMIN